MPYSIDKFEVNAQYAGFYQEVVKREFVSSKRFILLCTFTLVASLLSVSYFSNSERRSHSKSRFVSTPTLTPVNKTTHKIATPLKLDQKTPQIIQNSAKPISHIQLPEKILNKPIQLNNPHILPITPESFPKAILGPNTKKKAAQEASSNLAVVDFKVKNNLLKDIKQVGLSHYFTKELTRAFAEKLDLKKVRPGDRFTILYHKHQNQTVKNGQILAAKYISRNKIIKVIRLNEGAHKGFFSLDKLYESTTKPMISLLRKPIKGGRVSSTFQSHRFHPILKRYRAHLGVDYAAAPGSPIVASGNGKITFVGYQHGYGNLVTIQHDKKYSTRYGHMARFAKIKQGSSVRQGQVIGFVGKTGYATGHHLHYEIRVNGKPQNPLTVSLPSVHKQNKPVLSKRHHQEIVSKARMLFAKMDELKN